MKKQFLPLLSAFVVIFSAVVIILTPLRPQLTFVSPDLKLITTPTSTIKNSQSSDIRTVTGKIIHTISDFSGQYELILSFETNKTNDEIFFGGGGFMPISIPLSTDRNLSDFLNQFVEITGPVSWGYAESKVLGVDSIKTISPPKYLLFSNYPRNFSFQYPFKWQILKSEYSSISFATSNNNRLNVNIIQDDSKTISEYLKKQDKISATAWEGQPSIQVQDTKKTVINGLNCIQRKEFLLAADNLTISTYFKKGNIVYQIQFHPTPGNAFDSDLLIYNQILSTFKFIN